MTTRRPRVLTREERELWRAATADVARPRARRKADGEAPATPAAPAASPPPDPPAPRAPPPAPGRQNPAPPLAPLDRRLTRGLGRGARDVDARLDLHGHTEREAFVALRGFLLRAQARGARVVVVVTGKGLRDAAGGGVLRRTAPMWLALPEWRAFVLGFETAGRAHGGDGALYVRLRRAAPPRA